MALIATGNYATTLQQRKDALQWCGVAPAALTSEALADNTVLSETYDDEELALLLNAQAAAINELLSFATELRATLIEAHVLATPPEE
ncbi:MAG: hypothetical protein HC888_10875 [Candidatus Competibacteraceae bacterium]|nr:hypothetical protein [Candidatus Competibacteraceae bacterium]